MAAIAVPTRRTWHAKAAPFLALLSLHACWSDDLQVARERPVHGNRIPTGEHGVGDPPSTAAPGEASTVDTILSFDQVLFDEVAEGYISLTWNGVPSADVYEIVDGDDHSHYRGVMTEAFISGLSDGTYHFRVRAMNAAGEVVSTSDVPAVVEVKHWPLNYALGLFAIGLAVVSGVVVVISRGEMVHRGGAS